MASVFDGLTVAPSTIEEILEKAKDWALANGVTMHVRGADEVRLAPLALFPSLVPKRLLQTGLDTMPHFSSLMHRVAHNHNFLDRALRNVVTVDQFTKHLWDIYTTVREEGFAQPFSLGLFRNDFMMDSKDVGSESLKEMLASDKLQLKQIEFNTIASSFAGLVSRLIHLHRYTLSLAGVPYDTEQVPDNNPALGMSRGLQQGFETYTGMFNKPKAQCVIMFLVSAQELNVIDQRWLQFGLFELDNKIQVIRKTFLDVYHHGELRQDKSLWIDGREVAVVYYRAGYEPPAYPTDKEWSARLRLERSRAIKCPSVHLQLAGAKKVQQELAKPGVVQDFLKDKEAAAQICSTFVGLYSLDMGEEGDAAVQKAINAPADYVLKPQREGGGNNLYGEEMAARLLEIASSSQRNAYILMERIQPLPEKNYLIKAGHPCELCEVVSEIGIYGTLLGSADEEKLNETCGHMLRTKTAGTDEGGIMAGFATLDTPFLVE